MRRAQRAQKARTAAACELVLDRLRDEAAAVRLDAVDVLHELGGKGDGDPRGGERKLGSMSRENAG